MLLNVNSDSSCMICIESLPMCEADVVAIFLKCVILAIKSKERQNASKLIYL